jgi:hypothetical protein
MLDFRYRNMAVLKYRLTPQTQKEAQKNQLKQRIEKFSFTARCGELGSGVVRHGFKFHWLGRPKLRLEPPLSLVQMFEAMRTARWKSVLSAAALRGWLWLI